MINKIKKFIFFTILLTGLILLFLLSLYGFLVYKPGQTINFIDKAFIFDYSIDIESIESNRNFINPVFVNKEIKIKDNKKNELIYIPNLKIGINLFKSLFKKHISLSLLEIDTFISTYSSSGSTTEPFLINGNQLSISNDSINISAEEFEFFISSDNSKIVLVNGNINTYPFNEINALMDSKENRIHYKSSHSFDSQSLDQINFIDLKTFKNHELYLNLDTKGYFDFKTGENKRIDKLVLKNSTITTNTDFMIKSINSKIFSNLDNELVGIFKSSLSDQNISGSILYDSDQSIIRTNLKINMDEITDSSQYFSMSGQEIFKVTMTFSDENLSMNMVSNLTNTNFSASIQDLNNKLNENTETSIYIENMSEPSYQIKNKYINAYIKSSGDGYFAFGENYQKKIKTSKYNNGFHIYLDLDNFSFDELFYGSSGDDNYLLKSVNIKSKQFNFLDNKYSNINLNLNLEDEIYINISGNELNGEINIDQTNFIKIKLRDSFINFNEIKSTQTNLASNFNNINLRFIGNNIKTKNNIFRDIDFYILKNKNILTIDNIKIDSNRLDIGPTKNNQKAYISYNKLNDLYKIKGSYEFDNSSGYFNSFTKYDFNLLKTDLNIQWNSIKSLTNLEGRVDFMFEDLNLNTSAADSTLLIALRILNLNGIVEGIDNISNGTLNINQASGNILVGKKRAFISSPIIINTNEAAMRWNGEILKNTSGELDLVNLDLSMRLKISENIPWYAALLGGIPAIAGGIVLENIFEDEIEDVSTIDFIVQGSIRNPEIIRLN